MRSPSSFGCAVCVPFGKLFALYILCNPKLKYTSISDSPRKNDVDALYGSEPSILIYISLPIAECVFVYVNIKKTLFAYRGCGGLFQLSECKFGVNGSSLLYLSVNHKSKLAKLFVWK